MYARNGQLLNLFRYCFHSTVKNQHFYTIVSFLKRRWFAMVQSSPFTAFFCHCMPLSEHLTNAVGSQFVHNAVQIVLSETRWFLARCLRTKLFSAFKIQ